MMINLTLCSPRMYNTYFFPLHGCNFLFCVNENKVVMDKNH